MSAPEEQAEEGPEYQSTPLTPVSPKPIHLPAPSNIPILEFTENQMDEAYNKDNPLPEYPAMAQSAAVENTLSDNAQPNQQMHLQPATATVNEGEDAQTGLPIEAMIDIAEGPKASQASFAEVEAHPLEPKTAQTDAVPSLPDTGGVDIQAILDNLASTVSIPQDAASMAGSSLAPQLEASGAEVQNSTPTVPPTSSFAADLPPRPATQDASFALGLPSPGQTISPAAQGIPGSVGTPYQTPSFPPTLTVEAAPGTDQKAASLPPPPLATFQQDPAVATPNNDVSAVRPDGSRGTDENLQWGTDVQKLYDEFLQDERRYVLEGKWDNFPVGSRLFIGNLPTERVTKRDLFHVFYKHGKLAQISIKQAYGFIQFLEKETCHKAHRVEQNVAIRGKKVNLEISKPQRNSKGGSGNNSGRDRDRGGQSKGDRYVGTGARGRDRSPSSPSHRRRRSKEGRRRSRSRSRSPRRSFSPGHGHSRNGSTDDDASLPLPHRPPHLVPEIQVIVKDSPDRAFVQYVDSAFKNRGIRSDVLLLSPRLNETAVVRRQIIEGVLAVMKLDHTNMASQKFGLSIFDRSAGNGNVRFEEYAGLDLNICVELVLRARQTAQPPQFPSQPTGLSQYGLPIVPASQPSNGFAPSPTSGGVQFPAPGGLPQSSSSGMPFPGSQAPNINASLANVDSGALQQLLGNLQRTTPQVGQQGSQGQWPGGQQPSPDILSLLSQLGKQGPNSTGQTPQQQQQFSGAQQPGLPPALASLFGQTSSTPTTSGQGQRPGDNQRGQGQQQQPDMNAIMAQLSRYNGR